MIYLIYDDESGTPDKGGKNKNKRYYIQSAVAVSVKNYEFIEKRLHDFASIIIEKYKVAKREPYDFYFHFYNH